MKALLKWIALLYWVGYLREAGGKFVGKLGKNYLIRERLVGEIFMNQWKNVYPCQASMRIILPTWRSQVSFELSSVLPVQKWRVYCEVSNESKGKCINNLITMLFFHLALGCRKLFCLIIHFPLLSLEDSLLRPDTAAYDLPAIFI